MSATQRAGRAAAVFFMLSISCVLSSGCSKSGGDEMPPLPRNAGQALMTGRAAAKPASSEEKSKDDAAAEAPKKISAVRSSSEALEAVSGKELLPGDNVIARRLLLAVQANHTAAYAVNADYPYNDGAAMSVSQEVSSWVKTKMAEFGFEERAGRPDLLWIIHVEPADGGAFTLDVTLAAEGTKLFTEKFTIPEQYSSDRMTQIFSEKFTPKLP